MKNLLKKKLVKVLSQRIIITIIVLLILAGVTINMVLGDEGIIAQARQAEIMNKNAAIEEEIKLIASELEMGKYGLETTLPTPVTVEYVIGRLATKGIVKEEELVVSGTELKYRDETNPKTFPLDGIIEWDNSQAEDFTYSEDGKTITAYNGEGGAVIIPEGVEVIGYEVFENKGEITSIAIPESVVSIETSAFSGSGIQEIEIPNGVTSIGSYVFSNCENLTYIKLPENMTRLEGEGLFGNCKNLEYIDMTMPITYIDSSSIFSGCSKLNMDIVLSEEVVAMAGYTFYGCSNIKSITVPNTIKRMGAYAFAGCSSLTSINIPTSLTSIPGGAFSNLTGITTITIPSTIKTIGADAFKGCTNLTKFIIECDGVDDLTEESTNYPWGVDESIIEYVDVSED